MQVPIRIKIERSVYNRKKRGFTAQDIYRDSEADMSYVLKVIRDQVAEDKLIQDGLKGRKRFFRAKPQVTLTPATEAADTTPLWVVLVKKRIDQLGKGGSAAVAKELDVSPATVSGIVTGNYPANTDNLKIKVLARYARNDIKCPVIGNIKMQVCMDNLTAAVTIGVVGSKPKRRLRAACLQCKGLVHNCG